jgi:hypothetical protein
MPLLSQIAFLVLKLKKTNVWLGVGAGAIAYCKAKLKLRPATNNKANAIVVASFVVRRERRRKSLE